jgi:hypothetical protein
MASEVDDPRPGSPVGGAEGEPALRWVPGEGAASIPPSVRLTREFKGLTVADLLRDEAAAARLPGRVQTALSALERGDLAAADALLPGRFGGVLPGPGRDQRAARRRRLRRLGGLALLAAGLLCLWLLRLLRTS